MKMPTVRKASSGTPWQGTVCRRDSWLLELFLCLYVLSVLGWQADALDKHQFIGEDGSARRHCCHYLAPSFLRKIALRPGFTFSFFLRIPPITGNGIPDEIPPKTAFSERKVNSNLKNGIPEIPGEIPLLSGGIPDFLVENVIF